MKLYIKLLFAGAVLGLFAGCAKTADRASEPAGRIVTLTATVDGTRASIENGTGAFKWQAGDIITVFISDGTTVKNKKFTLDEGGAGSNTASFSATVDEGFDVVGPALYPYHDSHSMNADGTVNFRITDYPNYEAGKTLCPMAAKLDGEMFSFKHIGSVVRVTIKDFPSKADRLKLSSSDHKTNGTFTLDMSQAVPVITAETGSTTTTFKLTAPGKTGETYVFDIPLPTGTWSNWKLVSQVNGGTVYITQDSNIERTLSRGQILNMPVLSGAVFLADFEDGVVRSNITTDNNNAGASALSVADNPFKSENNPSDKVLMLNMSASSTGTSGLFKISTTNADYTTGFRNNCVSFRMNVLYSTPEDAAVYFPYVKNSQDNTFALPSRVNGQDFTPQDAATWASLINPNGWNTLEYPGTIGSAGNMQLRPLVDIGNNTLTTEGSRKIYFDDFVFLK